MQKSKNYTLSIMVSLIFLIVIFLGGGAYLVLKYHASNSSVKAANGVAFVVELADLR